MKFQITRTLDFSPLGLEYIQAAIDSTPANVETLESILEVPKLESGMAFNVHQGDKLYAVLIVNLTPNENNNRVRSNYLNIVVLGGEKLTMHLWKDDIWEFISNLAQLTDSEIIAITGRQWEKIFPLKRIGYVYSWVP